jgi:hypothetical protein
VSALVPVAEGIQVRLPHELVVEEHLTGLSAVPAVDLDVVDEDAYLIVHFRYWARPLENVPVAGIAVATEDEAICAALLHTQGWR